MEKRRIMLLFLLAGAAIFAFLTFRFPDLDIRLLGIGKHRYFLFHSAIVPLAALWVARKFGKIRIVGYLTAIFAIGFLAGVGIHLVTDVFQTAPVKFPFIGSLVDGTSIDDRLWEGGHALICFGAAWKTGRRRISSQTEIDDIFHE